MLPCLKDVLLVRASLVAQMVKRLSAVQETRVRSLGWEDPLEKEMDPAIRLGRSDSSGKGPQFLVSKAEK